MLTPLLLAPFVLLVFALVGYATSPMKAIADIRADLLARLRTRLPMLVLPYILLPAFQACYTAAKFGIPHYVGFWADPLLVRIDHAAFGTDPWRVLHHLLGRPGTALIEAVYVPGWFLAYAVVPPLVALCGSRRQAGTFALAWMLCWGLGGIGLAYLFASAGPVFVHFVDLSLAARFAPLEPSLATLAPAGSHLLAGIDYLETTLTTPGGVVGGGISAMPSMHVATAVLYIAAARGTRLFLPAAAFAALVYMGSIHTGYHYASDGVVGALVAWASWRVAARVFARIAATRDRRHAAGTIAPASSL